MMRPEDFDPIIGTPIALAPALRRIVAPNASPMTWRGTNTYLLGNRNIAVIDPGPDSPVHMDAILAALTPGQKITQILVTHSHLDHSPLAAALSGATGAPVVAFGDSSAGRSAAMQACLNAGMQSGGEGIDHGFRPDIIAQDGDQIDAGDTALTAIHTPGHMGNHLSFVWDDAVFCGDHVMDWATSLVSPPDGDLTDFMNSCDRLLNIPATVFHAGHGAPITAPHERLKWLITHRLGREAQIIEQLGAGPATAAELAEKIYVDTPAALIPAATRNVFAHLIDLEGKNRVLRHGIPDQHAHFELV